jgi:hypothetical protein
VNTAGVLVNLQITGSNTVHGSDKTLYPANILPGVFQGSKKHYIVLFNGKKKILRK